MFTWIVVQFSRSVEEFPLVAHDDEALEEDEEHQVKREEQWKKDDQWETRAFSRPGGEVVPDRIGRGNTRAGIYPG